MLAQAAVGWRWLRRLASAGLLALFLALLATPLAVTLSPRDCGCNCPRNSHSCCCRRGAHDAEPGGLQLTSVSCCNGHCPRATAAPVTFPAFPVPLGPARVAPTTSFRPLPAAVPDGGGHSTYLDLSVLYQRPPPLA
jgi:hypothetical protein